MKIQSRLPFSFFVCLIFVLLPLLVAAQKHLPNTVYLKNGNVARGKIIENHGLQGIRIENDCGIWKYAITEFDSIGYQRFKKSFATYQFKKKGYYNLTYFGGMFGAADVPVPTFITINGYHFDPQFYAGIGTGFEYYDFSVVPLFADLRYYFLDEKFSPYIAFQTGYGMAVENKKEDYWGMQGSYENETFGGFMFSTSAGISVRVSDRNAIKFGLGYRYQKLSYTEDVPWSSSTPYLRKVYTQYNRISVTVGFLFL